MSESRVLALLILALVVAPGAFSALAGWGSGVEGSGHIVSEERAVESFHAVASRGSIDVVYTPGPASLRLEGDDNLLELIETEVREGVLVIGAKNSFSTRHGLTAYVSAPTLDAVRIKGSGDVEGENLSGASLEVSVHGSGDVTLTGEVARVQVSVKGSGDVDLSGLSCVDARVSVMGSGDVDLHVTGRLEASVMGSGDVTYSGDPVVERKIMGSGDVAAR